MALPKNLPRLPRDGTPIDMRRLAFDQEAHIDRISPEARTNVNAHPTKPPRRLKSSAGRLP